MAKQLNLPALALYGAELAGGHLSRVRGRGLNFEEYRTYQPGDDTRYIDWSVTQRTGEAHVKVYTEEKERPVYLIVDQRKSMFFASLDTMKSVVSAQIAALFTWGVLHRADRVGAMIVHESGTHFYRPKRTRNHALRILADIATQSQKLESLASLQSDPSSSKLDDALLQLIKLKPKGALVVVMSDFYGLSETSHQCLQALKSRNALLGIAINDPMELEIALANKVPISDGKRQLLLDSEQINGLSGYYKHVNQEQGEVSRLFSASGMPLIKLDTSGNHIEHFVHQLRGRMGVK